MRVDLVCAFTCFAATTLFLSILLRAYAAAINEIIIFFYSGRVTAVVLLLCANAECEAKRNYHAARFYDDRFKLRVCVSTIFLQKEECLPIVLPIGTYLV